MKLVFDYTHCFEPECYEWDIPFEYESKEKFIFDVIKKPSLISILGVPWYDMWEKDNDLPEYVKNIDEYVFTLEEWFNINKKI